jgi:hypothetical protein
MGEKKKRAGIGFRSSISLRSVDLLVAQDPLLLADPGAASSLLFFFSLSFLSIAASMGDASSCSLA